MFESFSESIKSCDTVLLPRYAIFAGISQDIYAYLSFGGISGAYTDSLCDGILDICKERGELSANGGVVAACGGNFAVSLASACVRQGHQFYAVLPAETNSKKQELVRSLGAKISLCSGGALAMVKRAQEAAAELSAYYLDYLDNDAACEYHRRITGPAIMRACPAPDAIIIGVGTGASISGVGESVKAWHPDCKIVAVEPYESRAISGGLIGRHGIAGLGYGFVPANYNQFIVDKVVAVPTQAALQAAREAQLCDGVPASPACGATLCAAKTIAEMMPSSKNIVCIFPSRSPIE